MKKSLIKIVYSLLSYFQPLFGEGDGGEGGEGSEGESESESESKSVVEEAAGRKPERFSFNVDDAQNETLDDEDEEKAEPKKEEKKEKPEDENEEEETKKKKPETEKKEEKKEDETAEHKLFEKVKENFKGEEFKDDNSKLDKALEMYDTLDQNYSKLMKENEKVVEMVQNNEQMYNMMADMMKGASFNEAIARNVDFDSITPAEGDPDHAKWDKAKQDRAEKVKKAKEFDTKYKDNQKLTKQNMKEFKDENKLSDEQTNDVLKGLNKFLNDAFDGVVSKETMVAFMKLNNMDAELAKAKEAAELEAKNKKVELEKKKVIKKKEGDGVPDLSGGVGTPTEDEAGENNFFGAGLKKAEKKRRFY